MVVVLGTGGKEEDGQNDGGQREKVQAECAAEAEG